MLVVLALGAVGCRGQANITVGGTQVGAVALRALSISSTIAGKGKVPEIPVLTPRPADLQQVPSNAVPQ